MGIANFIRTRCLLLMAVMLTCVGCVGQLGVDTQSLLLPQLHRSEVLGFFAGLGTTFASLPDLIVMLRRKSAEGMNPRMAAITGSFQILWIWYGLTIASRPVILWNAIGVLTNFFSLGAYLYFVRVAAKR
jgi:uncharacterized protein with PQ loop repeat